LCQYPPRERNVRASRLVIASLCGASVLLALAATPAFAAPPPPAGPHPRIALNPATLAALKAKATTRGSAVADAIEACKKAAVAAGSPSGYQGDAWAFAASACALAYQVTGTPAYAARGITLLRALLEDVGTIGDKLACVSGAPPDRAIASIRRDTGYAIRFVGPHAALTYDWLHDAPGMDPALRQQARDCFGAWLDWYGAQGYLANQPGANYHAGFVAAKALIAVALGAGDGPGDLGFRLWNEVVDDQFGKQIVANGLAADSGGVPRGDHHGALVGGDWPEGWQYGPLSVVEYAFAARALEEQGASWPELRAWSDDLALRFLHGLTPPGTEMYAAGDSENDRANMDASGGPLLATLLGPSSPRGAGWAAFLRQRLGGGRFGAPALDAIAEARAVSPVDPTGPGQPLWFLARGTRNLYARSGWDKGAFWAVLTSAPRLVADHQHLDASSFVFARGGDPLIVDPSPYGSRSTLTSNAVSVDSDVVLEFYKPSQTPSSTAQLPWARGTRSGVVGARADFAGAFNFNGTPSDVPLARRDWVFLPEGEIVAVDRVRTGAATRSAYLRFRTPAALALAGDLARGVSGSSALAIHAVALAPPATPQVKAIPRSNECEGRQFGACGAARFAVGEYSVKITGGEVLAIHVIDGLGAAESPAEVAPMNAVLVEGTPQQNREVVGAMVRRAGQATFVVASSAIVEGAGAPSLSYAVPGGAPSRHVVFDAPEDDQGRAAVTATAAGDGRCRIALARAGGGAGAVVVAGRPAIFTVGAASGGCAVAEDRAAEMAGDHADPVALRVLPSSVQPRSRFGSGCACAMLARVPHKKRVAAASVVFVGVALVWLLRRPRRRRR
jgi:hypothetical protein